VEKISIKAKLIADFEKDFEDVNKEYNKENFHEANFVEIKKNIYYIY